MADVSALMLAPSSSLRDVILLLERTAKGIALVVDERRQLLGTVTDGDIRRAMLAGMGVDAPLHGLLARRVGTPITMPVGTPPADLLRVMNERMVRHLPLVNEAGLVEDIALLSEMARDLDLPLRAVVMAGGFGTRLRPLTERLPKPMLPVGERPLLELIINQFRQAGIHRVNLTTHYKADLITQHFGDGKNFGVEIEYVKEDQPLGTAGALGLMEGCMEPLLVVNGDILTRVDFRAMLQYHREHRAQMTVAVRAHEVPIPFGVIETEGVQVTRVVEKPRITHFVSAGIYLVDPAVCGQVPRGEPTNMPDLINRLVAQGKMVVSFPVHEYWMDIGQTEDYRQALVDVERGMLG